MNEIQFLLYNLPDNEGNVQVVIKDEDDQVMYSGSINLNANLQILNVPQSLNHRMFSIEIFAREENFYGYFIM